MVGLLGGLLVYVIALAVLFGFLCSITGEGKKGNLIIVNCVTAIVLYMLVIQLFNSGVSEGSVFASGIPLVNNLEKYKNVLAYVTDAPLAFALDFVELVTLTLLINWISNLFSFENAGFAGTVVSRIIIVLAGIIAYGFFMDAIRENIIIKWCVYCVECIITGGSILYTPILMLSFITGLKKDNMALTFLIEQFPKTSIGKAITTAITSSVMFVVFMVVLETQYGSMYKILEGTLESVEAYGGILVMIIGIYIVLNSLKSKK